MPGTEIRAELVSAAGDPVAYLIRGALVQMGPHEIARERWDWEQVEANPFWCPDAETAEAWAEQRGIDLEKSFFYTDSYSDAPMLRVVGNPRVISPDPRLSREARQRGWPILQW